MMTILRTIRPFVVAGLLACGPIGLMGGCGDSGAKTEAGKVAPMQTDDIKKAMEANGATKPPATKGGGGSATKK